MNETFWTVNGRRCVGLDCAAQGSLSESVVRHESLVKEAREGKNAERYFIHVRSYRCGQQCDPDNLAGKYFIDSLRYAGIIPDDTPEDIIYLATQRRTKTKKRRANGSSSHKGFIYNCRLSNTMKKLFFVFSEGECGEIGGVLDEAGKVLDVWSCNDATWRNEYFSGFMAKVGIECVESSEPKHEKALIKFCKKEWGI